MSATAAYVHIPFCNHHCGYCDFAVAVGKNDRIADYLHALDCELQRLGQPAPVDTLFLGGGTPTFLAVAELDRCLTLLHRWLPLRGSGEYSIEANPNTLTADKIRLLADHGVNRVSLGSQSFQPELLHVLERDHDPADVLRAVADLRPTIPNFSLDLIFGVPGQTLAQWRNDLDRAIELGPTHISTYGLTYEKGTRLWKQRRVGQVQAIDEDAELEMYLLAQDVLASAGFEHYEISNHARPGYRCRHNLTYWANDSYLGFGMGAAKYVGGERSINTRDLETYLRRATSGRPIEFQRETLPPRERALETIAVQMRRCEGVQRPAFQEQTGFALDDLVGTQIARHVELGLLTDDDTSVALTRQGKCVADALIMELWTQR